MIRADLLTKRFGPITAVENVSFEVQPGQILGFLGPNGAGKSTTLRILSGYLPPSSGKAWIGDYELTESSKLARKHLGYLPELFCAPPELRVEEYLKYRSGLKGIYGQSRRKNIDRVCELLDLGDRRRQLFGNLSKGFRQRVGLADALLADPPALLLDEPFGGLDPLQRRLFKHLLQDLTGEGKAILFSSHVLPEVEELATQVFVLFEGHCRAYGTQEELSAQWAQGCRCRVEMARPETQMAGRLSAQFPELELESIDDHSFVIHCPEASSRSEIFSWLGQQGQDVVSFETLEPGLEELFGNLTSAPQAEGVQS